MIGCPGPHVLNEPRRWRGQEGAGTLEKTGGNVWEVGKEGAGSGTPKEEESGRNRKVVKYFAMEKAQRGRSLHKKRGRRPDYREVESLDPNFHVTIGIDENFLRGWKTKQIH